MRSYEAIFGDLDGRRLVCVRRHILKPFWRDGFHFCTYRPNFPGQRPLKEKDVDKKKVYPFSYLQISPMKGRFFYRIFETPDELSSPKLVSENPWLGFMSVCCTPIMRCGKWTAQFRKNRSRSTVLSIDQWKNTVEVGPGNDLLAALCMAYVFDKVQCQPMITHFGKDDEYNEELDNLSLESGEDLDNQQGGVHMENMPDDAGDTKRSSGDQAMQEQAPQMSQQMAEQPIYEDAADPFGESLDKSADQPVYEDAENPFGESLDRSAAQPVYEDAENPFGESLDRSADQPVYEDAENPFEESPNSPVSNDPDDAFGESPSQVEYNPTDAPFEDALVGPIDQNALNDASGPFDDPLDGPVNKTNEIV